MAPFDKWEEEAALARGAVAIASAEEVGVGANQSRVFEEMDLGMPEVAAAGGWSEVVVMTGALLRREGEGERRARDGEGERRSAGLRVGEKVELVDATGA